MNNAGIATGANLVAGDLDRIRLEMDTLYFGTLNVVRAFAPVLAANGGGAILNILSVLSWFSCDGSNPYAAAKAAEWSLANGIRLELAGQRTLVTGVHLAAADTDLMAGYDGAMIDPADAARAALDGVQAGRWKCWWTTGARPSRPHWPTTPAPSTTCDDPGDDRPVPFVLVDPAGMSPLVPASLLRPARRLVRRALGRRHPSGCK